MPSSSSIDYVNYFMHCTWLYAMVSLLKSLIANSMPRFMHQQWVYFYIYSPGMNMISHCPRMCHQEETSHRQDFNTQQYISCHNQKSSGILNLIFAHSNGVGSLSSLPQSHAHACVAWRGPLGTWIRKDGWLEGSLELKDRRSQKLLGFERCLDSKAHQSRKLLWVERSLDLKARMSQKPI